MLSAGPVQLGIVDVYFFHPLSVQRHFCVTLDFVFITVFFLLLRLM